MNKKITIVGGDLRNVKLAEMLAKDGIEVYRFGLENADILNKYSNITKCETLEQAINSSEIIIGPIPLSSNRIDINTPFSDKKITLNDLLEKMENKIFIAGSISQEVYQYEKNKNLRIIDLLNREELAVLNTISTAEGAIQIAIEQTQTTIHGSNVLVMGFGRVGKILSKMLAGIGANVYCEARKNSDLAWIKAYGYNPVHLNEIDEYLGKFDIIINTIPFTVLDGVKLDKLKEDCLVIDLASAPGGVDKEAAKKRGIKAMWALSLPGKVAPLTSAEFLKETIYNILKEENQ